MIAAVVVLLQTAEDLRGHVEALADDGMEGRNAGSAGCERAAAYLAGKLKAYGYEVEDQPFEFTRVTKRTASKNVLATLAGEEKDEIVVIGAHYDALGKKGDGFNGQVVNPDAPGDEIWNGADGNASGCAAVLEIARAMAGKPAKRTIVFAFFSAGEYSRQGARHYAATMKAKAVAMINLDMIGRNPDQAVEFGGGSSSPDWKALVAAACSELKHEVTAPVSEAGDHIAFSEKRVPTLHVFTNFHADYHAQTDHAGALEYARMATIAKATAALARAAADKPPAWSEPVALAAEGPKLGIKGDEVADPEADQFGLGPAEGGLRVDAVEAGSAAEAAGIKTGDVLVSIDGRTFPRGKESKAVLFAAIRRAKSGADVAVIVVRAKKRVTLTLRIPVK